MLGDLDGGAVQSLLALLGMYTSTETGKKYLPTYCFVTFVNGSIQLLTLVDVVPFYHGPLLSSKLPAIVNLAHACVLAAPCVSFAGFYCAFRYLQVLRANEHTPPWAQQPQQQEQEVSPERRQEFAPFVGRADRVASTVAGSQPGQQMETPREMQ